VIEESVESEPKYCEYPAPEPVAQHVICTWVGRPRSGDVHAHTVFPDGCTDIIWDGRDLIVAGPDTAPVTISRDTTTTLFGIRFRPGAGPALLGTPAVDILDARPLLVDLWSRDATDLADRLSVCLTGDEARAALLHAVHRRLAHAPPCDEGIPALVAILSAPRPPSISSIADRLALSERQLHRRCLAAFGYGAKTLQRILRFQRFLAAARAPQTHDLAQLAAACGFADQAHLSRECKRLGGKTPRTLLVSSDDVRFVQDNLPIVP
jgi:AraC-like DNA-binding protein